MPKPKTVASGQKQARAAYSVVPVRTVSQDPAEYTKNPHQYGEILIKPDKKGRTKLGGALQRDLYYWIARKTWGANVGSKNSVKRPEYAKLSLGELVKLCSCDRRTVARALRDLEQRGILESRDRKGCGPTVAKMYKLTPEKWKDAPYYVPPTAAEIAADEDTEQGEEEQNTPDTPVASAEQTVQPGKVSKPQAISLNVAKGVPDVTIRLVYRVSECPVPLTFSARTGRNGRMQISCRGTAPQRFAISSPSVKPATVEDERVKSYSEFVSEFVLQKWGKAADEKLISAIISASGDAPIETFKRAIQNRIQSIKKTGILINLAADAARADVEVKKFTSKKPKEPEPAAFSPEEVAELEEHEQRVREFEAAHANDCKLCSGKGRITYQATAGRKAETKKCGPCSGTGRKA